MANRLKNMKANKNQSAREEDEEEPDDLDSEVKRTRRIRVLISDDSDSDDGKLQGKRRKTFHGNAATSSSLGAKNAGLKKCLARQACAPSSPVKKSQTPCQTESGSPEQLGKSAMEDIKAAVCKIDVLNSHVAKQEAKMRKIQGDLQKHKDATIKEYLASEDHKMALADHLEKSREAIVKDYLASEEYLKMLEKALADHLMEFKKSEEYNKEFKILVRKLRDLSNNAQQLLNAESMMPFVNLMDNRVKVEDYVTSVLPLPSSSGSSQH